MIGYWLKKGLFRNANHAIWFINTVFFFIFIALFTTGKFGKSIFIIPLLMHLSPIINSINTNYIKKEKMKFILQIVFGST